MDHTLVGLVIEIDKIGFPVFIQGIVIDRKTMVLRGDVSIVRADLQYGL